MVPFVLHYLAKVRLNVLACIPGIPVQLKALYEHSTIQINTAAFRIDQVTAGADWAIVHGGHGIVSEFLLAGKPVLCLPLYWEQELLAKRLDSQGLGKYAYLDEPQTIIQAIREFVMQQPCLPAATEFALK